MLLSEHVLWHKMLWNIQKPKPTIYHLLFTYFCYSQFCFHCKSQKHIRCSLKPSSSSSSPLNSINFVCDWFHQCKIKLSWTNPDNTLLVQCIITVMNAAVSVAAAACQLDAFLQLDVICGGHVSRSSCHAVCKCTTSLFLLFSPALSA